MFESDALKLQQVRVGTVWVGEWRINPGEIVCLSGVSGSGKSRLLRAIADLEPFQGQVCLGALLSTQLPAHQWRARVMLVPAESHWWAETVAEHFPAEADEPPEALGLPADVLSWSIARLSSGEKQRLALWRALCRKPDALLLDEPTANLDETTTTRVEQWLVDLIKRRTLPTIWVTHDREQSLRVAQRRYELIGGGLREVE